jgi:hypothetical protein
LKRWRCRECFGIDSTGFTPNQCQYPASSESTHIVHSAMKTN